MIVNDTRDDFTIEAFQITVATLFSEATLLCGVTCGVDQIGEIWAQG